MTNQTSYVLHSGFSISGCRWVLGLGQGLEYQTAAKGAQPQLLFFFFRGPMRDLLVRTATRSEVTCSISGPASINRHIQSPSCGQLLADPPTHLDIDADYFAPIKPRLASNQSRLRVYGLGFGGEHIWVEHSCPPNQELSEWMLLAKNPKSTWVVVKIMVPFWVLIITRHLIFRVPKKGP